MPVLRSMSPMLHICLLNRYLGRGGGALVTECYCGGWTPCSMRHAGLTLKEGVKSKVSSSPLRSFLAKLF